MQQQEDVKHLNQLQKLKTTEFLSPKESVDSLKNLNTQLNTQLKLGLQWDPSSCCPSWGETKGSTFHVSFWVVPARPCTYTILIWRLSVRFLRILSLVYTQIATLKSVVSHLWNTMPKKWWGRGMYCLWWWWWCAWGYACTHLGDTRGFSFC